MQTCTTTLEISMMASQKIGNQPTSGSNNTIMGIHPKDAQSHYKGICSTIFIAALCEHLHIRVLLSSKNNDILNFAFKLIELENTIQSEVTQTQKDEYGMYLLISGY